ncbi:MULTISPECIES: A24 family peptidase [unclassified Pseudactinotalea]|uniref:prepilin peptidase n=1 Tax=unclassified Pseudactinotalea TaxID=2649176 RepID=UPI00128D3E3C|nr:MULTISPECIES: A24 family peptidase [unclassified Pseudactinotalea]MPV49347.1 prepilin peptidase [Pseudactinotalea sp. HY160]QGH69359.1 prepilin peptidase [Pseudactinotalea sp. HY158]
MRRLADADSPWLGSGLHALVAALLAAAGTLAAGTWSERVTFTGLAVAAGLLVTIDLAVHRLPDRIVLAAAAVAVTGTAAAAWESGSWQPWGRALLAGIVVGAGFLLLALASPTGLGLGDVKLAAVLGTVLGWFGWQAALTGILAGFVCGGVVALIGLALRRTGVRDHLAFGPWLILGSVAGIALTVSGS